MHLISPSPGFILQFSNSRVPSLTSTLSNCCCYSLIHVSYSTSQPWMTQTHTHSCLPWAKCRSTKCHYEACHVEAASLCGETRAKVLRLKEPHKWHQPWQEEWRRKLRHSGQCKALQDWERQADPLWDPGGLGFDWHSPLAATMDQWPR